MRAPAVDLACISFSYCISNGALGEMRVYIHTYTEWNGSCSVLWGPLSIDHPINYTESNTSRVLKQAGGQRGIAHTSPLYAGAMGFKIESYCSRNNRSTPEVVCCKGAVLHSNTWYIVYSNNSNGIYIYIYIVHRDTM